MYMAFQVNEIHIHFLFTKFKTKILVWISFLQCMLTLFSSSLVCLALKYG